MSVISSALDKATGKGKQPSLLEQQGKKWRPFWLKLRGKIRPPEKKTSIPKAPVPKVQKAKKERVPLKLSFRIQGEIVRGFMVGIAGLCFVLVLFGAYAGGVRASEKLGFDKTSPMMLAAIHISLPVLEAGFLKDPEVRLSGISILSDDKFAIMNDRVYRVGDRIQNAKVVAIDERSVTLRVFGRKIYYEL